jgi:hypothetical protein
MATQDRPIHDDSIKARSIYGVLLVMAVIAVLVFAARYAFPSGLGIEREPVEEAPLEQTSPR